MDEHNELGIPKTSASRKLGEMKTHIMTPPEHTKIDMTDILQDTEDAMNAIIPWANRTVELIGIYDNRYLIRSRLSDEGGSDVYHLRVELDTQTQTHQICISETMAGLCVKKVAEKDFMKLYDQMKTAHYQYNVHHYDELPSSLKCKIR